MFAEGLPSSMIAERLGCSSRSAVIGKLHRLGLRRDALAVTRSKRQQGRKASRNMRKNAQVRAAVSIPRRESSPLIKAESYVPPIMSETAPPNATSLDDLRLDQCRWPYGDTEFVFCPETQGTCSSYCPGHHARVYTGVPPQRRTH